MGGSYANLRDAFEPRRSISSALTPDQLRAEADRREKVTWQRKERERARRERLVAIAGATITRVKVDDDALSVHLADGRVLRAWSCCHPEDVDVETPDGVG